MRFASGARLGPFEILESLGAGGMGEVYRARDTRLDRTVAIKLLPEELTTTSRRVDRFRHEARAIARITHPNICALHDVGEDGSSIFLVMEYVDGVTLAARLEDGALPLPLALRTAVGIADALDHAHRNGVVHRDLKPGNIMLTRDSVKLLDFGLAKLKERDEERALDATQSARLTEAGIILGTVPYMSPEQIEGRDVDARTDIFSFGVVLYEMVSGRRPFVGASRASLMAAIVSAEPVALATLHPRTPAPLDRLIQRCLAKDPDDRWQTARDLAAELRWTADAGTAPAKPPQARRMAALLWSAVGGAALAAALGVAAMTSVWPQPVVPEYVAVTFRKGAVSSARFTPDGRSFVYSASWGGQPYGSFLGRAESPDARDLQLTDSRILSISRAGEMAVAFGPQNITHAFGEQVLARIAMAGGARRDVLTHVVAADWIPGTDTLAVIRDPGGGRPFTVEFPAGKTVHETPAAWSLRVSPDGTRVAFFEGPAVFASPRDAMITVIDNTGRKSTLARNLAGIGLAWAPSGNEVWYTATSPGHGAPYLNAVSMAGVERTVNRAPDWLVLHDIAADGRVLLSRNTVRINAACSRPGDTGERDLSWLLASSVRGLSADGQTLVFEDELFSAPSGNPTLYRRSLDGSPAVPIGDGAGAALSPDGHWVLAASGNDVILVPTGAGTMMRLPKTEVTRVGDAAWLGDSKRIVFTGHPGDGKTRGYIQEVPAGAARAFTPEGVVLAGRAAVRDDISVLGRVADTWRLYPIGGGESHAVPALRRDDLPLQWSHGGRFLYMVDTIEEPRAAAVDVVRLELSTGSRIPWKTLRPSDPVGVEDMRETIAISPDAQSYCYSYLRRLGDLYVVEGLR